MRRVLLALITIALLGYGGGLAWIEFSSWAFAAQPKVAARAEAGPVVAVAFYDDRPKFRRLRTMTGVRLLQTREADFLVTVGGWRPGRGYLGARDMRDDALANGIQPAQVAHDRGSNDSVSNLAAANVTIRQAIGQPAAIILVSDRYHLLRLALLARDAGLTAPLRFQATPDDLGALARLKRLNYEALAYLSLLLPKEVASAAITRLRMAGPASPHAMEAS